MKYIPQENDDDETTILITKRIRRKIGYLINGNETIKQGLERVLDEELKKI